VLGAIGSGVDFEMRIAAIYQSCRKQEEIKSAFDQLQLELNFEIDEAMTRTRQKLLDNFDDEVREKLKIRDKDSKAYLNRFEHLLMDLTRHELNGKADFIGDSSFELRTNPFADQNGEIPLGLYELPRRSGEAHLYRLNHPLAERIINEARKRELPTAEIHFDHAAHEGKVTILQPLLGHSGWLSVSCFTVESLDQAEDHLLFAAVTDMGQTIDEETAIRLLTLPARVGASADSTPEILIALEEATREREDTVQRSISERNALFFETEAEKLEGWADDLKLGLEREIKDIDRQIKEARRAATAALTLEEKLSGQKQIKALEAQRSQKRRSLFDAQDNVEAKRDEFIQNLEAKLNQKTESETLFNLRWVLN
jgi:adenine-specific DNA-methyltransferase